MTYEEKYQIYIRKMYELELKGELHEVYNNLAQYPPIWDNRLGDEPQSEYTISQLIKEIEFIFTRRQNELYLYQNVGYMESVKAFQLDEMIDDSNGAVNYVQKEADIAERIHEPVSEKMAKQLWIEECQRIVNDEQSIGVPPSKILEEIFTDQVSELKEEIDELHNQVEVLEKEKQAVVLNALSTKQAKSMIFNSEELDDLEKENIYLREQINDMNKEIEKYKDYNQMLLNKLNQKQNQLEVLENE